MLPEHSPHDELQQENIPEPTVLDSSPSGPGTNPVHYPWGSVSSLLMNSKGEEIIYPVEDYRNRIWARRLEWVVDQHLDRAEDEQNQLQHDFEAVLRQYKQARERKYDQATISYLSKQLDTARKTIWALRRRPFGRLNPPGLPLARPPRPLAQPGPGGGATPLAPADPSPLAPADPPPRAPADPFPPAG